jgi:hypothetical protein
VKEFELLYGASWLSPQNEVYPIQGFHEEWLIEHEELAEGSRNVCELVLRKRWISVNLFAEGYLELMVADRHSPDVTRPLFALLSRNASHWTKALVMSMDEEGYSMLEPRDAASEELLVASLKRAV